MKENLQENHFNINVENKGEYICSLSIASSGTCTVYIIAPSNENNIHSFFIEKFSRVKSLWKFDNRELIADILNLEDTIAAFIKELPEFKEST